MRRTEAPDCCNLAATIPPYEVIFVPSVPSVYHLPLSVSCTLRDLKESDAQK